MKRQMQAFAETAKKDLPEPELFRESPKVSVPFWARYFIEGEGYDELIRFCKLFFVINVRQGLEERLSSIRSFDYDERNKMWAWVKRGNKVVRSFETTVLGTVSIK